ILAFSIVGFVPFDKWRSFRKPLMVAAVIATLIALLTPVSPDYPAHRWIRFGGLSLQSVEVVKLALVIGLAVFLDERILSGEMRDAKKSLHPIAVVLAVIGVVVALLQKDFGSTAVIIAMV